MLTGTSVNAFAFARGTAPALRAPGRCAAHSHPGDPAVPAWKAPADDRVPARSQSRALAAYSPAPAMAAKCASRSFTPGITGQRKSVFAPISSSMRKLSRMRALSTPVNALMPLRVGFLDVKQKQPRIRRNLPQGLGRAIAAGFYAEGNSPFLHNSRATSPGQTPAAPGVRRR